MAPAAPRQRANIGRARPPSAIRTLPTAIVEGNLPDVQRLIQTAANELQLTNSQKVLDIALSICCENADRGCNEILQYVLEQGADPNSVTSSQAKSTPLLRALQCYDKENPREGSRVKDEVLRGQRIKAAAKLLIENGANVRAKDQQDRTALFHAALLNTHWPVGDCIGCSIAELLLQHGADINATDNTGRSVLVTALWRGHHPIVRSLISQGVNLLQIDKRERTIWHHLADDPKRIWNDESLAIADLLMDSATARKCIAWKDEEGRTSLHCAAATGASVLAKKLLDDPDIDINAVEHRNRTPLWVAVRHNRKTVVDVLLDCEAKLVNVNLAAKAGLTPLHIASRTGSSIVIFQRLLDMKADPNIRDGMGKTPLHLACEAGNKEAVDCLLATGSVKINTTDKYGNTPLLGAASGGHHTIVSSLAPWTKHHIEGLSSEAKKAAKKFSATVVNFGPDHKNGHLRRTVSVFDVLYSDPLKVQPKTLPVSTLCKPNGPNKFRWIHLPVNDVSWCRELLTKRFVEEGAHDFDGFKALERSFNHQHRGEKVHSSYMRPMCQTTSRSRRRTNSTSINGHNTLGEAQQPQAGHNVFMFAPYIHFETHKERCEMQEAIHRAGLQPNQGSRRYITFATDAEGLVDGRCDDRDELLIRARLSGLEMSNSTLHLRRTLDQSFYRTIDTDVRDHDQVIYKYEKKRQNKAVQAGRHPQSDDLQVLMVDQLWMWILGDDLIVTSFPQRWHQPPTDPTNVLESIIQELNLPAGDKIENVHDLAMFIAGRCFGTFGGFVVRQDGSRCLDMFESAIGEAMEDETQLFDRFKEAAGTVSRFLERRFPSSALMKDEMANQDDLQPLEQPDDAKYYEDHIADDGGDRVPNQAISALLNIGMEAKLLSDVKDIRDELDMMKLVFMQQRKIIPETRITIQTIFGSNMEGQNHPTQSNKAEHRLDQYARAMDHSVEEIERMDKQAERIYQSIRDLLDLKQKHANAFEAQYSRIQTEQTARQGLTIMVFTVVTVIFLPLSFIASFFAINIKEFPHDHGSEEMSLGFVCTYIFGIGLVIAVISVIAALSIGRIVKSARKLWKTSWAQKPPGRQQREHELKVQPATGLPWTSGRSRMSDEEAFETLSRASFRSM